MKKVLLTAALLSFSTQVFATEGINLIGIGPVQQGTAGAGVAAEKNSTWTILNPAGISKVAPEIDISLQVFAPVRTMNSSVSGTGEQEDDSVFFIPELSGVVDSGIDGGTIGLGLYGTSGMGVDYDMGRIGDMNSGMSQSYGDNMTELSVMKIVAAYSHDLGDGLSIGAGPVFVYSRLKTNMLDGMNQFSSGDWDDAYGIGFVFGVDKNWDKFSVGISYMTEQYMSEFDEYDTLLSGSLDLPHQITVGTAYEVVPSVELLLDYRWIGWGQLDTLGDQFGWEDQNIIKIGANWDATEKLTLRTGFSIGNSPIDEDTAFGNSLFPAIIEKHLSVGMSYMVGNFNIHAAYTHAFENSITANGNDSAAMGMGNFGSGTEITMYQNSFTIGLTYLF